MQSLSQRERQAKVDAIAHSLDTCLNDAPFKPEMAGVFWSHKEMADYLLARVEQVELDYEQKWYETHIASGENYPRIPF